MRMISKPLIVVVAVFMVWKPRVVEASRIHTASAAMRSSRSQTLTRISSYDWLRNRGQVKRERAGESEERRYLLLPVA